MPKEEYLNMRVDSDTKRKLEQMADEDYRSMADTVIMLINREYSRRGQEPEQPVPNLAQ